MCNHAKTSAKFDGSDPTLVQPSDWNAGHGGNPDAMLVKTATTTLASWTTAATLIGAAGTRCGHAHGPRQHDDGGYAIRIKARGVLGTASTAPTLNVAVTLGGVAVCSTGAITLTEALCRKFYAKKMGRPGIAPGLCFRCLLLGYFEGIDSERCSMFLCLRERHRLQPRHGKRTQCRSTQRRRRRRRALGKL